MTAASSRDCGVRRDVIVRGRRISYLEAGAGERTCVLIHGLAASWDYWLHTVPALAGTYRIIAVDLPGFGRSENPDNHGIDAQLPLLPEFFDAIGLKTCDVVSHSMGTLVAYELATRYPERVRRLVLSGGPITSVVDLFNLRSGRFTPSRESDTGRCWKRRRPSTNWSSISSPDQRTRTGSCAHPRTLDVCARRARS